MEFDDLFYSAILKRDSGSICTWVNGRPLLGIEGAAAGGAVGGAPQARF